MNSIAVDGRDDLSPKESIKMKKLAEQIVEASNTEGK